MSITCYKKPPNHTASVIILFALFLLISPMAMVSCTKDNKEAMKIASTFSTDSAIEFSSTLNQTDQCLFLNKYFHKRLLYGPRIQEAPKILQYLKSKSDKTKDPIYQNEYYNLSSAYFIQKEHYDTAVYFSRIALNYAQKHCPELITDAYHAQSLAHYHLKNLDSALFYWKIGYKEAALLKDQYKIYLFASNLGTYYFNNDELNLALKFFTLALDASSKLELKEPILTNNVIATLISQRKPQKAYEYWEKHKNVLELNTETYKGQLLYISRINLLQMLNRIEEANGLLNQLKSTSINPVLQADYYRVLVQSYFDNNTIELLQNDSQTHEFLESNIITLLKNHEANWVENLSRQPVVLTIPYIESSYNNLKSASSSSNVELSVASKILGQYYSNKDLEKANRYLNESLKWHKKIDSIQFDELINHTDELTQLEITFSEIREKENQIERDQFLRNILIISIIILVLIIGLTIQIFKNHLKIKAIEKEKLLNEQKALSREKELNNRVVEYSKSLLVNNKIIKQQLSLLLSQVSLPVQKQIKQIQSGLEEVVSLDPEENPAVAEKIIGENEDWELKYPGFNTLNKTEKRVFVLTMENYKSKEIAHVLGVATQYVRNVKSRLRKKLNLPEDW